MGQKLKSSQSYFIIIILFLLIRPALAAPPLCRWPFMSENEKITALTTDFKKKFKYAVNQHYVLPGGRLLVPLRAARDFYIKGTRVLEEDFIVRDPLGNVTFFEEKHLEPSQQRYSEGEFYEFVVPRDWRLGEYALTVRYKYIEGAMGEGLGVHSLNSFSKTQDYIKAFEIVDDPNVVFQEYFEIIKSEALTN